MTIKRKIYDAVNRNWWQIIAALLVVIVALMLTFMAGCAARITEEQAQQLAQGKADVEAARLTSDQEAFQKLIKSAAARFMSAVANMQLPAPATKVDDLVGKDGTPVLPAVEREVIAAAAAEETPPVGFWGLVAAGAGGAGLLALSVLRFSPGVFGAVASIAHTLLAPQATKEMREAERKATVLAQQAVAYGHAVTEVAEAAGLKPSVEAVKTKFSEEQDALGIRTQMCTILQAFKDGKTP